MSHFAQVQHGIVTQVIVAEQDFIDSRPDASEWIQTSYNTRMGIHYGPDNIPDGGIALRYRYAQIGGTYDSVNDVFTTPQPFPSWIYAGPPRYNWQAPVPYPIQVQGTETNYTGSYPGYIGTYPTIPYPGSYYIGASGIKILNVSYNAGATGSIPEELYSDPSTLNLRRGASGATGPRLLFRDFGINYRWDESTLSWVIDHPIISDAATGLYVPTPVWESDGATGVIVGSTGVFKNMYPSIGSYVIHVLGKSDL